MSVRQAYRCTVAGEADIPFIAAVYEANIEALHGTHRTAEDWRALLADAGKRYFIVHGEEGPAAWFRIDGGGEAPELGMLQVAPARQRQGVGRFVLHTVERMARESGAARVVIHTTQDNAPAAALYSAAGYILTGTGPCTTADGAERVGYTFEKEIQQGRMLAMLTICKLRPDPVIDFAAVELKKYLRMMMPECGDIDIRYAPDAGSGFRLGLLADFGLETPGDPVLDDTLHIDTDETGGVIAGSNSRSVLLAVYRFLTENGCRWLYPGVDGEHIPVRNIAPVRFHKTADYRFRGFCNEGCESQACMLETIDFFPKIGLNVYMMEFDTPFFYYDRYYRHVGNQKVRPPEPVTKQQVKQWKRMCETEIERRGLQFHDMGHGWTAEPFGFDSSSGWHREDQDIPEESRRYLAEIGGKREFFRGVPLLTNVCMSNPEVRTIMAKGIADYAEKHKNVDFLHVWLADDARNHCECTECAKMRPSDWYMMIMNELDEMLTARGLDTRIVFISYVDTLWGPEKVRIQNPERFSLLVAHATRGQMAALPDKTTIRPELPYVRNAWKAPETAEENLGLIQGWKKLWQGPVFSYEYHFFMEQYYDPGSMAAARKLYDDLHGLRDIGIDGFVEDASQRCFFPNGLSVYTYAQTLFDQSLSYEAIRDDYLRHAYGADYEKAQAWLQALSDAFDFDYLQGLRSEDPVKDRYFAPSRVKGLQSIAALAAQGKVLAAAHGTNPTRPQAVSWRLLQLLTEYSEALSDALAKKAGGQDREARAAFEAFLETFGQHEFEIERYFDQGLMWETYTQVFSVPKADSAVVPE